MLRVHIVSIYLVQDFSDDNLPVDENVTLDNFWESITAGVSRYSSPKKLSVGRLFRVQSTHRRGARRIDAMY
jgi:hypothetical protein